jgi:hypothetical protein
MTVTFSKTRKVRVFPKIAGDEKCHIWWTQEDLKAIRKQCWQTLKDSRTFNCEQRVKNDEKCLRGLEDWSKDICTERRKRMRDAILGVILEQECLKNEEESIRIANLRGSIDAQLKLNCEDGEMSPISMFLDRKRRNPFPAGSGSALKGGKPSRTNSFSSTGSKDTS